MSCGGGWSGATTETHREGRRGSQRCIDAFARPREAHAPDPLFPVGTAPSLRSKLSTLEKPAKRAAPAPARKKAKTPPFARNPVLQELEPRLLMSADLNPLASDTLLASPALTGAEFRSLADQGTPTVVTSAAVAPIQRTNELVFVDTATPDYQQLVDGMRESALAQGRNLEFVLIDQERDGIRKITDTLAQKSDLDAIHVISHATDGSVQLGSAKLDFDSLVKRAASIKRWGNALTEAGDILFYGCDLAASAEGKSLLDALSRLTGADVAASEDRTGAAAQGGDWDLEFRSGAIEAQTAFAAAAGAERVDAHAGGPDLRRRRRGRRRHRGRSRRRCRRGWRRTTSCCCSSKPRIRRSRSRTRTAAPGPKVTNSPQGTGTAGAIDATRLTVFWSRYNGTQGAPTTTDSGAPPVGRIDAFRGVVTSATPFNISSGSNEGTSDTSLSATGATTTAADSLVVVGATISMELGTENFGGTWTNGSLANTRGPRQRLGHPGERRPARGGDGGEGRRRRVRRDDQ